MGAELRVGVRRGREQELPDPRHARDRGRAERRADNRDVTPARRLEALGAARVLDEDPRAGLAGENHREPRTGLASQGRGEREEDTRAVAGDAVSRPGPPVPDRRETGKRSIEQLPGGAALDIGNEADAARVALSRRIVQSAPQKVAVLDRRHVLLGAHCAGHLGREGNEGWKEGESASRL